jgi:hypothetical protein
VQSKEQQQQQQQQQQQCIGLAFKQRPSVAAE